MYQLVVYKLIILVHWNINGEPIINIFKSDEPQHSLLFPKKCPCVKYKFNFKIFQIWIIK